MTVPRLYAIADHDVLGSEALPEAVEAMARAGVGWIQLRGKHVEDAELFRLVEDCVRRLTGSTTDLWVDDRADIAALFPVFGVHVGQRDLPPAAARRVVGSGLRIGLSTHDEAQLCEADGDAEVDVVALGPIFPTRSKERADPVVGLDGLRRLRSRTAKPLVAIGGIDETNIAEVLAAGADSAAVLGAVCHGPVAARSVANRCRGLLAAAEGGG